MEDVKGRFRIVETPCFPNPWKVVPVSGRDRNTTFLYHPTIDKAKHQIEQVFGGIHLETIYMEN